jgi:hypothetical protein
MPKAPVRKRFRVDEYYKLGAIGILNGECTELVEGEIIEIGPVGACHAAAVSRVSRDFYELRHPGPADVFSILTISDTALDYDRNLRVGVYAALRIPECWVLDLADSALLIFRAPSRGDYKTFLRFVPGDAVALQAFPDIAIAVSDLIGSGQTWVLLHRVKTDALIRELLDAARRVHETLGPGFVESIYARALLSELRNRELQSSS